MASEPQSTYTGPCIFCDAVADTEEDIFSSWIVRDQERRYPHIVEFELVRRTSRGAFTDTSPRPVPLRLPVMCRKCNNVWGGRIEQKTKPVIEQMMVGEPVKLSRGRQYQLARLALVKFMCLEFETDEDVTTAFFTKQERHLFRKTGNFPLGERLWIWTAKYGDVDLPVTGLGLATNRHLRLRAGRFGAVVPAYAAIFGVEHLWFCLFAHRGFVGTLVDPTHDGFLVPIWPRVGEQTWPPIGIGADGKPSRMVFDDESVDSWLDGWTAFPHVVPPGSQGHRNP
jgi:hypothetical protein